MQSPDSSLTGVPGGIALNKAIQQTLFAKFAGAVCTRKEAPTILMKLRLDDPGTFNVCRDKLHLASPKEIPVNLVRFLRGHWPCRLREPESDNHLQKHHIRCLRTCIQTAGRLPSGQLGGPKETAHPRKTSSTISAIMFRYSRKA